MPKKTSKKIEDIYRELTPEEHVLQKSGMYIGSIKTQKVNMWIYENSKMVLKEIEYIPAFLKLFDEIISNSVDESKREKSKLDIIKVSIKDNYISVFDSGGIPCVIHKEKKQYIAEMVFSSLRTGSNFNEDDNRIVVGTNGLGSCLVNLFSKEFIVSSCDGNKNFYQVYKNNMSDKSKPKITISKRNHTEIKFLIDFERLSMSYIDDIHYSLIHKRIIDLAGINPKIKFYFNDERIKISSFEEYIKLYTDDYIIEKSDHRWKLAISPSNNGFKQISFANGSSTTDGGTHVDYILNQIILKLREYFSKKYKVDIKPSDIKNHIMIFIDAEIINPGFNSQTKEKLITEAKDFGYEYIVSDKFIQSILKSEIVQSILDWIDKKKIADENKLARDLNKSLSKIKVDKLIDAKGKDRLKCSLLLFEGESAVSPFRKYRDTNTQGGFALRGKFTNVSEITNQKLINNSEVINLMGAIGLKLGNKPDMNILRYGKILLYMDADPDGNAIIGLLINFLYKFWPELFEHGMIYKVETPLVVCLNSKSKKNISFYSQQEYDNWVKKTNIKDWEIGYMKGLAALSDNDYKEIINNPKMVKINKDDNSLKYLNIWFGKESDLRKIEILK